MQGREKECLLWMAAVAAGAVAAILWVTSCGGEAGEPQTAAMANAENCTPLLTHAVLMSASCAEAQMRVDLLLRRDPYCVGLFGDAGLDVCAKARDGGTADGNN